MRQYEMLMTEGSRRQFLEFAAEFDAPAFVRRAQRTAECERAIMHQCAAERRSLLELPRMRLGVLGQMVELHWERLEPQLSALAECTPGELAKLHDEWQPVLRVPVPPTSAPHRLRRAMLDTAASFEFFNRKWQRYVDDLDLSDVNQVRHDYNNYYVVEKACAFGSERIGQAGFKPLLPLTHADIWQRFPLLRW